MKDSEAMAANYAAETQRMEARKGRERAEAEYYQKLATPTDRLQSTPNAPAADMDRAA